MVWLIWISVKRKLLQKFFFWEFGDFEFLSIIFFVSDISITISQPSKKIICWRYGPNSMVFKAGGPNSRVTWATFPLPNLVGLPWLIKMGVIRDPTYEITGMILQVAAHSCLFGVWNEQFYLYIRKLQLKIRVTKTRPPKNSLQVSSVDRLFWCLMSVLLFASQKI